MEANSLLQSFYQLRENQTHFLRYSHSSSSWVNHQCKKQIESIKEAPSTISTLTLNVLTDAFSQSYLEKITCAETRYAHIINQAEKKMCDIMGFNQVTCTFYEMFKQAKWVQQNYYISKRRSQSKGFGNLLCTKIEPVFVDRIHVPSLRTVQTAFLPIKSCENKIKIICFCSAHLISLSKNFQIRDKQFSGLIKYLERYKDLISGIVIQGDMNFHEQNQKFIFENHKFKDSWLETYDLKDKPGYTFDGDQNWLINEFFWGFQRRRMRLDRVLYRCPQLKTQQINIIFNQPIYGEKRKVDHHMFLKGGILAVGDYLGVKWKRQKDKYLFPSDHFGLLAKLSFKQLNIKS